ncbi:MAG: hypothetical protein L3J06_05540 [Cyclobacteriaceae bacterium]|nr:hypothetical protein [Cyclobacteriaceae bacterium]
MKHNLLLVFLFLLFNIFYGQKIIEIPKNDIVENFVNQLPKNLIKYGLDDLRNSSDSLGIRIWRKSDIFTLSSGDSLSFNYKIHIGNNKPLVTSTDYSENISRNILDSLISYRIMELQDETYRGIDGSFVFFEISTKDKYRIFSYWSPQLSRSEDCKSVVQILNTLYRALNTKKIRDEFLNSLEPGGYRWGMSSIRVDRFLSEEITKTDFYLIAENKIRKELNITYGTSHLEYPLVIINGKLARIASLNQYLEKDIVSFNVLKPDNPAVVIYGTAGSNGVVRLETK